MSDLPTDLESSRASSARLMEALARKIGANPAVRTAASGVQRAAHYVQDSSVKDVVSAVKTAVRRRPAYTLAAAVVAGFLLGRALRGGSRD